MQGKQLSALVTGGAGFIGSNLVNKLISLHWKVTVIDNESAESNENFYWNEKAQNYKFDICDYSNTRHLYDDIDYVFHMAAESRIQLAIDNPIKTVYTNELGTCTVLQCAREANVKKVIYSSTSAAYGKNEPPHVETQKEDCLNPYSVSKVSGEKLCAMYTHLFGLNTIILRYFNVYGPNQPTKGTYCPVIGVFFKQKSEHLPLSIVGDGKQKRDFIHVSDVVDINILSATKDIDKKFYGTIFNIGTNKNFSVNDIAKLISKDHTYIPSRIGEANETLACISKVTDIFDWKPQIDVVTYIKQQLALRYGDCDF